MCKYQDNIDEDFATDADYDEGFEESDASKSEKERQ